MARVKPQPRLVRGVEVGETVHDVAQLGDHRLSAQRGDPAPCDHRDTVGGEAPTMLAISLP